MSKGKIYIAYGSNMNQEQMMMRCGKAVLMGKGMLKDYELIFRGTKTGAYANIEKAEGGEVPILIWRVEASDIKALDIYEGYPVFYDKQVLSFDFQGEEMEGFAYVMTEGHLLGMPTNAYLNVIAEGYHKVGLDCRIIDEAVSRTKEKMIEELEEFEQLWEIKGLRR